LNVQGRKKTEQASLGEVGKQKNWQRSILGSQEHAKCLDNRTREEDLGKNKEEAVLKGT